MPLPLSQTSPALKEWAPICQALATGRQNILLRKGGIREGKKGFHFQHQQFYLFPTYFHSQKDQLRELPESYRSRPEYAEGENVSITLVAQITESKTLQNWEDVTALTPQHIWKEGVIQERFQWGTEKNKGSIEFARLKIHSLSTPIILPYEKEKYGGCRSWVDLPIALQAG